MELLCAAHVGVSDLLHEVLPPAMCEASFFAAPHQKLCDLGLVFCDKTARKRTEHMVQQIEE